MACFIHILLITWLDILYKYQLVLFRHITLGLIQVRTLWPHPYCGLISLLDISSWIATCASVTLHRVVQLNGHFWRNSRNKVGQMETLVSKLCHEAGKGLDSEMLYSWKEMQCEAWKCGLKLRGLNLIETQEDYI